MAFDSFQDFSHTGELHCFILAEIQRTLSPDAQVGFPAQAAASLISLLSFPICVRKAAVPGGECVKLTEGTRKFKGSEPDFSEVNEGIPDRF